MLNNYSGPQKIHKISISRPGSGESRQASPTLPTPALDTGGLTSQTPKGELSPAPARQPHTVRSTPKTPTFLDTVKSICETAATIIGTCTLKTLFVSAGAAVLTAGSHVYWTTSDQPGVPVLIFVAAGLLSFFGAQSSAFVRGPPQNKGNGTATSTIKNKILNTATLLTGSAGATIAAVIAKSEPLYEMSLNAFAKNLIPSAIIGCAGILRGLAKRY